MRELFILEQLEHGITHIEIDHSEPKNRRVDIHIRFGCGSPLFINLSEGEGIYSTKHRWKHEYKNEMAIRMANALANWKLPEAGENPFAKGGPFDSMHLMIRQKLTGKKDKSTVVWREIFKINHQERHEAAMKQVDTWDNSQLTTGLFRTFLWHLLFEYDADFKTATPDQVKGFLDHVKRQVEAGVYQKSYANQAQRIVEFSANLAIYNKNGVLRRPASGIQNPHFKEVAMAELTEAFQVAKRSDMPPKTPLSHHIALLEYHLTKQADELEAFIAEERKNGHVIPSAIFHSQRRAYRSMVIFLLVKEHGLFPRDIACLQLEGWVPETGELAISEEETIKVSAALKRHLTNYLEMVDRDSTFLDHDQDHLLVRCLYYPSADTVNEWIEQGQATNQESYEYRPIGNDIVERVFVVTQMNSKEQVERLPLTAKKVRNYFLKRRLTEGAHSVKTSYYSKKFLSEKAEDL